MSSILVDSSVWISFFKGHAAARPLSELIALNQACINDLIFSELAPSMHFKNETKLLSLFMRLAKVPLMIDWPEIVQYQTFNLKHGINKVGIPDLIIMQNAVQNRIPLYTFDAHFALMAKHNKLPLFRPKA